jgi:hypothetical protein
MKKENIKKMAEPITIVVDEHEEGDDGQAWKKTAGTQGENHDLRNILIFVLVILVIAGMAYLIYFKVYLPLKQGPAGQQANESYTFNNFEFNMSGPLWQTQVQVGTRLITVPVHYGPREIRWIEIIGYLNKSFDSGPIYLTFDPEQSEKNMTALAASELALNLAQGIQREVIAACAKNVTSACATRPIVNCDDSDKSVIYFLRSNETVVEFNNNCILIMGSGDNLVMATDRLILYWYRIMKKDERLEITATPQVAQTQAAQK